MRRAVASFLSSPNHILPHRASMLKRILLVCLADPGEPPYRPNAWWDHWWRCFWISVFVVLGFVIFAGAVSAHDSGQWTNSNSAVREWYKALMQPDVPTASCCGEADAYWADEIHVKDGKAYATITDDRPDGPLGRPHIDNGTVLEIPTAKLKYDRGNPTGHGIVFLSRSGFVYCYVQPGGV